MFLSKSLKLVPKKEVHVFQWPLLDLSRKVGLGIHWNGISRKWCKSLEETFPYPSQSGSLKFASKELHAEVSNHTRQWPPACQCDHASAPRPTRRICENQGVLGSCVDSTWNVRTGNSSQLTSSYNGTYLLQELQVQTPTILTISNFHKCFKPPPGIAAHHLHEPHSQPWQLQHFCIFLFFSIGFLWSAKMIKRHFGIDQISIIQVQVWWHLLIMLMLFLLQSCTLWTLAVEIPSHKFHCVCCICEVGIRTISS